MTEQTKRPTFAESQAKLANVFSRLNQWIYEKPASIEYRHSAVCERCGYDDCVCGTPEFETFVSQALDAAAEVDQ